MAGTGRTPARRRRDLPPPRTGRDERALLTAFLDYLRDSVAAKLEGAPEPAVRTAAVASGTNLLGLVTHLTFVERHQFLGDSPADWQATFHARPEQGVEDVLADYRAAVADANEAIAACADLDQPAYETTGGKGAPSLRWALVHMVEETGRHAGHADILRELIDGRTGR